MGAGFLLLLLLLLPQLHLSMSHPCFSQQVDLWKTSGHFDFYRESMFNQMVVDAEEYQVGIESVLSLTSPMDRFVLFVIDGSRLTMLNLQLKPMNCPFHIGVYKQGFYSYRDLPIRWAELGTGDHSRVGLQYQTLSM